MGVQSDVIRARLKKLREMLAELKEKGVLDSMMTKKNNKRRHFSAKRKALKPIPNFKNLEEEAHFWDTHDTTEYAWQDLDETIEVAGPLKRRVEKRRAEHLAAIEKVKNYLIDEVGNMVLPGTPILDKKPKRGTFRFCAEPNGVFLSLARFLWIRTSTF